MSDTAFSYLCNDLAKEGGSMENSSSLHHYMEIKRLPHAIMQGRLNKEGEVTFDPSLWCGSQSGLSIGVWSTDP